MCDDRELNAVFSALKVLDPDGQKFSHVLRNTLDQLYDGQRTGRYDWDQLRKTEKTHGGTLVEINLQREFDFKDGNAVDYSIEGVEVDCKFSGKLGGWMIPPENVGTLCLVVWANDRQSKWSLGLIRPKDALLVKGNRDKKRQLKKPDGMETIRWLFDREPLPTNALLKMPSETIERIMSQTTGQQKVNELFRSSTNILISRTVVATVAQQKDPLKRVRRNGGARSHLKSDGIIILGGYKNHQRIAEELGVVIPGQGEFVSVQITNASGSAPGTTKIGGSFWRVAGDRDTIVTAPALPNLGRV